MSSKGNRILVLDFGSQYTQLIARRVRENEVYSEILPWDIGEDRIKECNPKGIILSGGPESVTESFTPRIPQICFDMEVPLLGICYGMQTLAEQCSGIVSASDAKEFGEAKLKIEQDSKIFDGIDSSNLIDIWMSHGDKVTSMPKDFVLIGSTESAPCLLYTSPSPRDATLSRMPSSA